MKKAPTKKAVEKAASKKAVEDATTKAAAGAADVDKKSVEETNKEAIEAPEPEVKESAGAVPGCNLCTAIRYCSGCGAAEAQRIK